MSLVNQMENNIPVYQYSRDYARLYELICQGFSAAGLVDYHIQGVDGVSRDFCSVRMLRASPNRPFVIYIGVRGLVYASVDEFNDMRNMDVATFFAKTCESINLEWINPFSHENKAVIDSGTMEAIVCDGADNALLGRLIGRKRLLGKYEAAYPVTVERVLAALDVIAPSEAGDVIHSLLWRMVTADHLSASLSDMLSERDEHTPLLSNSDESKNKV